MAEEGASKRHEHNILMATQRVLASAAALENISKRRRMKWMARLAAEGVEEGDLWGESEGVGSALSSLSRGCTQPGMIATFWTTASAPELHTLPSMPMAEPEMPYSRLHAHETSHQRVCDRQHGRYKKARSAARRCLVPGG